MHRGELFEKTVETYAKKQLKIKKASAKDPKEAKTQQL